MSLDLPQTAQFFLRHTVHTGVSIDLDLELFKQ